MKTTKKKRLTFLSVLIAIIIVGCFMTYNAERGYRVVTFRNDNGWGYNILYDQKTIIHQPFMPAINGQKVFSERNAARMTGKLVVSKLRKHKLPGITSNELYAIITDPKIKKQ